MGEVIKTEGVQLPETQAKEIELAFKIVLGSTAELEEKGNDILSKEITEENCKDARRCRLDLVTVTSETSAIHKREKADVLLKGRAIDGLKNAQLLASKNIREKLMDREKHFERLDEMRIKKLDEDRTSELRSFGCEVFPASIGAMDEAVYNGYRDSMKAADEVKRAADEKAENERLEKIEADKKEKAKKLRKQKAEQKRIADENKKLRAEAEKRDAEEAKREEERKVELKKIQDEQAIADKKLAIEKAKREKVEKDRRAKEENARLELKAKQDELDRIQEAEKIRREDELAKKSAIEKREANQAHRKRVNNLIVGKLMFIMSDAHSGSVSESEVVAKAVVTAIAKGEIENLSINY